MKITVYINEESLQGQLCSNPLDAVNNLMAVINALQSNHSIEVALLTSSNIFSKQICTGTGLMLAQLSKSDHDLFLAFKNMLDKAGYWDKAPKQLPGSVYLYKNVSVKDTSVAEARETCGDDTMLVSFPGTNYEGTSLDIEKDGVVQSIPHAITTTDVFDYLRGKGIKLKYDRTKYLRVDDSQTVLADSTQFENTGHIVQGRTVYERIGKDEYWYVDNFHKDGSVHLEVFRMSDGAFLGTCDIEDVSKFKEATTREKRKKQALKF